MYFSHKSIFSKNKFEYTNLLFSAKTRFIQNHIYSTKTFACSYEIYLKYYVINNRKGKKHPLKKKCNRNAKIKCKQKVIALCKNVLI